MITIVTATRPIVLPQATLLTVLRLVEGWVFTTYETYPNFMGVAQNRPKSHLLKLIQDGRVDKLVQVGYTGRKTKLVKAAERLDLDVTLIRSTE